MHSISFPSKHLENAVHEISKLPGIGNRTALRLVLHILRIDEAESSALGNAILDLKKNICYCQVCNNISDSPVCNVCSDKSRDLETVCVVESIKDVMAIENTHQFRGGYHVLGGIISPMDGIGPGDLDIDRLEKRVADGNIKEVILALSTTMEGDTTNFYLYKRLTKYGLAITTIARGVAIGDELEYADEVTLGRSIVNRTEFRA